MAPENHKKHKSFSEDIGRKEQRRMKAKRNKQHVWSGFGLFGMIGWSVVTPTVLGAALGSWLDRKIPGQNSYTLACLIAGLCLGCFIAWNWIHKENKQIKDNEDNHE
ncbi:F0F1 ATP synthase subunit [Chitinophaga silvatica]|uniref:F0F1 ATP synthase subunit n=1 Tax=Chitinophaga silvatica TaxID=2282649 RepID=A0A3E1Y651_9BACT|nr:AtpZ/AtpI family protein [Chitinophaga silvatica]RFS20182.1 F0F1 ATP synthase subunit [Chitinophaga silvatica]